GRDPALVAELDAWLRAREADGTLAALRARWLGAERARARSAFASDLDALLALVDLRLAFMPAVAAAKRKTGRPVEDPGQEARAADLTADPGALASLDPERVAESLDGSLAPAPHRRAIASAIRHLTASRVPESGRGEGRAPRPPAGGRRDGAQLALLSSVSAG